MPQQPSDRATKGCLGNLKSCLEEQGLLSKKTQGIGRSGRWSLNPQRIVVMILLPFTEPLLCARYALGASHT